jgi:2-polyprenyl-3-methyl-5-hydroxy-6-metoxy-1,4-benzoquinol methylase
VLIRLKALLFVFMQQYDSVAVSSNYHEYMKTNDRFDLTLPTLQFMLGDVKAKKILDIACGDGTYSQKMKAMGAASVLGVDISSGMIL